MSQMIGYTSPEERSTLDVNLPEVFVSSKSRSALVSAYQNAMDHHIGSTNGDIVWKKDGGKEAPSNVILVPYAYEGHPMALHFVSKK